MADDATPAEVRPGHRRRPVLVVIAVLAVVGAGIATAAVAWQGTRSTRHATTPGRGLAHTSSVGTGRATTTIPAPTTTTPTTQPPGPGFLAGRVSAVGDSVMLDYQDPLRAAEPGIDVEAAVSRQWSDGLQLLESLKAQGQLGAEVVVGLGTNGPISAADVDAMMAVLGGASRVVFVNVHVDRPWQDPNNAVLAAAPSRYPNVVVADWADLAAQHPEWFGADGTHLAIDGPGADALAALVVATLVNG